MRNKLQLLSNEIDGFNADFTTWMKTTSDLMERRKMLVEQGRQLITKREMDGMLFNASVKFGTATSAETPLADHLPEFDDDGGEK